MSERQPGQQAMFGVVASASVDDFGGWLIRPVVSMRDGYHVRVELALHVLGIHGAANERLHLAFTAAEAIELGSRLIEAGRDAHRQNTV